MFRGEDALNEILNHDSMLINVVFALLISSLCISSATNVIDDDIVLWILNYNSLHSDKDSLHSAKRLTLHCITIIIKAPVVLHHNNCKSLRASIHHSNLTMSPHNQINHQTKRCKPPTPNSTRLRPLHRRPRNTSTHDRIPHIVLSPVFFDEAFRPAKDSHDECELSGPVHGFISGGAEDGAHLFSDGGLGYFLSVDYCYLFFDKREREMIIRMKIRMMIEIYYTIMMK